MTTLTVPSGYGVIVLESLLMGVQLAAIGMSVNSVRSKFFTKEFFEKNFPKAKEQGLPTQGGYPDMGSGLFSQKLLPSQWVEFNNAQRAHYNYLEGIIPAISSLLVSGLFFTKWAAIAGGVYIAGRALYTLGYKTKGPKGRMVGALTLDVALFALIGMSLYGTWGWAGGLTGIKELFLN